VLIVDNARDDRELLVSVLTPLGFELEQAASGLECLEILPRFAPDLIFMDLAMPGIDGWETIRRIRRGGLSEAQIAVISANAYDKGLDNDVGLPSEDFFLKPLSVAALLDWIGERLGLEWVDAPPDAALPAAQGAMPFDLPPQDVLASLARVLEMGYLRGVMEQLDQIDALGQTHAAFTTRARELAREFRFEAVQALMGRSGDA
jgi:CheY-like chemotaxis protein